MTILTHEVAKALRDRVNANDPLELIRATEQAVLERLAAGVSVEPVAYSFQLAESIDDGFYGGWGKPSLSFNKPIVPADSIRNLTELYTAEAIAAARVQALEEAAKVCDRTASEYKGMFAEDESLYIAATDCANEIRALIGEKHD